MRELKFTGETETFSGISNIFIDHYMAESNGEFVKLYLYLVRFSAEGRPLSVHSLADLLHCTDKDVIRGIKHWVSKGVLKLTYSDKNSKVADGIEFCRLRAPESKPAEIIFLAGERITDSPDADLQEEKMEEAPDTDSEKPESENVLQPNEPPKKTMVTLNKLRELTRDDDLQNLIHEAEAYFNHMLAPAEINTLHYIYRDLEFSFDLCEFLLEYTASIGKKSFRYIEAVAREWYKQKITTREEAEAHSMNYNSLYYTVQRELGLPFSSVTVTTKTYADKWTKEYGFTKEIILEACRRAVQNNANRPLEYVDGILRGWHQNGVRRFADIANLDAGHKTEKINQKSAGKPASSTDNIKLSFPQTDMKAQMKEIEDLWLNSEE